MGPLKSPTRTVVHHRPPPRIVEHKPPPRVVHHYRQESRPEYDTSDPRSPVLPEHVPGETRGMSDRGPYDPPERSLRRDSRFGIPTPPIRRTVRSYELTVMI